MVALKRELLEGLERQTACVREREESEALFEAEKSGMMVSLSPVLPSIRIHMSIDDKTMILSVRMRARVCLLSVARVYEHPY